MIAVVSDDDTTSFDKWDHPSLSSKSRGKSSLKPRTQKVNTREVEQFGSWDLRMNFPLMEEESIRRGTPIPQLTIDKVGFFTHQGRREYQVSIQ